MRLNQVTVSVTDIPRAIEFYQKLGMALIVRDDHYARFELPGGETYSIHLADKMLSSGTRIYFEFDDVDKAVRDAEARGVVFTQQPTDQSWLWREALLSDPDGNPLCFLQKSSNRRFPPWRLDGRKS
ncbi:VOC family protein [Pyruvatibacter sp.]|uniref:VOC family protein n=1 Tax=Pyruvatibacter sp. TaxID=1981328 RepID=UPI0032EC4E0C